MADEKEVQKDEARKTAAAKPRTANEEKANEAAKDAGGEEGRSDAEELAQAGLGSSREPVRYDPEFQLKVNEKVREMREKLAGEPDEPVSQAEHEKVWAEAEEAAAGDEDEGETEEQTVLRRAKLHYYGNEAVL